VFIQFVLECVPNQCEPCPSGQIGTVQNLCCDPNQTTSDGFCCSADTRVQGAYCVGNQSRRRNACPRGSTRRDDGTCATNHPAVENADQKKTREQLECGDGLVRRDAFHGDPVCVIQTTATRRSPTTSRRRHTPSLTEIAYRVMYGVRPLQATMSVSCRERESKPGPTTVASAAISVAPGRQYRHPRRQSTRSHPLSEMCSGQVGPLVVQRRIDGRDTGSPRLHRPGAALGLVAAVVIISAAAILGAVVLAVAAAAVDASNPDKYVAVTRVQRFFRPRPARRVLADGLNVAPAVVSSGGRISMRWIRPRPTLNILVT
jgi:hypothetical protein